MKNKFSSLCIISALLLGSSNVEAAYYIYGPEPNYAIEMVSTCNTCNTCNQPHYRSPCAVKHHYHHVVRHHHPRYDCASRPYIRPGHYSISTYNVYSSPCGNALWVPSCGCNGRYVSVQEYNQAFYGPYYPVSNGYSDFDMDTRTADDVYVEY